jgi:hypothetical protein
MDITPTLIPADLGDRFAQCAFMRLELADLLSHSEHLCLEFKRTATLHMKLTFFSKYFPCAVMREIGKVEKSMARAHMFMLAAEDI